MSSKVYVSQFYDANKDHCINYLGIFFYTVYDKVLIFISTTLNRGLFLNIFKVRPYYF
jgi:hypothetical protein